MKCIWKVSDSESICCYYFPLIIGLNNEMSVSVAFETVHPVYFLEVLLCSPPCFFFFFSFFCLFYFGVFFWFHFSLMLITSWACMKMTSLTLCISMCHSPSKACLPIFVRVLCLCCVSAEQAYSRKTGTTRVHRYLTWNVVFISLSLLKY